MENLAPAGNREALERAVAAGADAVYLGYAAYSARAGAGNFDEPALREAVHFAHLHHVRVHVTVNTLIKDGELSGVMDVLRLLNELRVDAVLVQDLGVLQLCRSAFPDLPVHASTQMAIHNASGARWCRRHGMTRAVLARECSVSEMAKAAAEGIEIEAFGHGAQCVAVSGECLFSSMIGSRSGNRGRCAQPCRLPYTYRGKTAAWLSPRDVCLRDHLPELHKAGVCSVKLEGRLKRPEYVATVAESYRKGIDSLLQEDFTPADEREQRSLQQIFQRGGFMRGYAMGAEDADVIYPQRVNHSGVTIGKITSVVKGLCKAHLTLALHDGDGLQIRSASGDHEMIYAGHDTPAGTTATLRLRRDMQVKPGDELVRLTDAEQLAHARNLPIAPIPCDMTLTALPGTPLTLTVTDGDSWASVTGEEVQSASHRALSEEDALRSLSKTGDTPFILREGSVITDNAFVPVSALNAIRRDALAALEHQRAEDFSRPDAREEAPASAHLPEGEVKPVIRFTTLQQYEALRGVDAHLVWQPEDYREEALQLLPENVWLQLPTVCQQSTLEMLCRFVQKNRERLQGVVLGSVGQLGMNWRVPMAAGEGVPVMNRRAAQLLLEDGCVFVTASPELSGAELDALLQRNPPIVVPAYGVQQLMLLHHCPARTWLGLTKGHKDCRMCDVHHQDALTGTSFTDRKGAEFPLHRVRLPEGCRIRLMNSLPTDLIARVTSSGWTPQIAFASESGEEVKTILRQMQSGGKTANSTSGWWMRPVE